tara:strand:+ start:24 stop:251 length:228 start_codon:yes stop_codon:yes gene_type:complete
MSKTKDYYWTEAENAMDTAIAKVALGDNIELVVNKLKDKNYAWSLLGYDEFEDDLGDWLTDYISESINMQKLKYN